MHTTHFEAPGGESKKCEKSKFPKWRRTEPKGNVKIIHFLDVFDHFLVFPALATLKPWALVARPGGKKRSKTIDFIANSPNAHNPF